MKSSLYEYLLKEVEKKLNAQDEKDKNTRNEKTKLDCRSVCSICIYDYVFYCTLYNAYYHFEFEIKFKVHSIHSKL